MVLAQLVRASDCGSEGHGFEPHMPPKIKILIKIRLQAYFFMSKLYELIQNKDKTEYIGEYQKADGLMERTVLLSLFLLFVWEKSVMNEKFRKRRKNSELEKSIDIKQQSIFRSFYIVYPRNIYSFYTFKSSFIKHNNL